MDLSLLLSPTIDEDDEQQEKVGENSPVLSAGKSRHDPVLSTAGPAILSENLKQDHIATHSNLNVSQIKHKKSSSNERKRAAENLVETANQKEMLSRAKQETPPFPKNWHLIPRKGRRVADSANISACKTPLDERFSDSIEEDQTFSIEMLSDQNGLLLLDLTRVESYYDITEEQQTNQKITVIKLPCEDSERPPNTETVRQFVKITSTFLKNIPNGSILVHDTYGYNTCGYLICCFLVETLDWSVEVALQAFRASRQPALFIDDLFERYNETVDSSMYPFAPKWSHEIWDFRLSKSKSLKPEALPSTRKQYESMQVAMPSTSVTYTVQDDHEFDVEPYIPPTRTKRPRIEEPKNTESNFFGGYRVKSPQRLLDSMFDLLNSNRQWPIPSALPIRSLINGEFQNLYLSWKPEGTEFLLLLLQEGAFLVNSSFEMHHLQSKPLFCRPDNIEKHFINSIIAGDMVIDDDNGQKIPRFLVSDLLVLEGIKLWETKPLEKRLAIFEADLMTPRKKLDLSKEPFRIRSRLFLPFSSVAKLFQSIIPTLPHQVKAIELVNFSSLPSVRYEVEYKSGDTAESFKAHLETVQNA